MTHPVYHSSPFQDLDSGKWYVDLFKKILATGKIKPIPVAVQPNGLAGVKDGLQYMQDGKVSPVHGNVSISQIKTLTVTLQVSAQKLTYRISDTPVV